MILSFSHFTTVGISYRGTMQERALIEHIAITTRAEHPLLKKGIGDDCAIMRSPTGEDLLVTADMLVEGVHFDTRWHDPYLLGRKALAVNVSDIAGMGGTPTFALLSIGLSNQYDAQWMECFLSGFKTLLCEYGCVLVGGDTVSAEKLTISVTMFGTVPENSALHRETAQPGDSIYVSGNLGSASAGLYLCQSKGYHLEHLSSCPWPSLLERHLNPSPRVKLGQLLRKSGYVSAMQDISDGIATDLSHICTASGTAGQISESELPADSALVDMAKECGVAITDFQISGGEDYELLFTVKAGCEKLLEQYVTNSSEGHKITRIGEITAGSGVRMLTIHGEMVSIDYQGYEHST